MKRFIILLSLIWFLTGCNEYILFEDYFAAFVPTSKSFTLVDAEGTIEAEYPVHLTSAKPSSPIIITYELIVGDGLKEGKDYILLNKSDQLTFYPGVYDASIKIKWLANPDIDSAKNNTLTIRLVSANQDLILGYPGPDEHNREMKITKYLLTN